jgi:dihydrofolate reductase
MTVTTRGRTNVSRLKFSISMSLDGYVAGPRQSIEEPLGEGGESLHEWAFVTRAFREMQGKEGGDTGVDDEQASAWSLNTGATIMGRNMFGPVRGAWGDEDWNGWWGDDPPYHTPVFVLTHHARDPVEMEGGTTFHFVTEGIEAALERARDAAGDRDVSIGGGASTVQQYLRARLVDEFRVHVVPVLLGGGERLFEHLDGATAGYECVESVASPAVTHYRYERRSPA